MQQKIHGLNVHASPSLSAYAEQKIFQPLSQMAHHLTTVVLRFRDEDVQDPHSPREARAVVTTTDGQVLVARDREDNDLYAAARSKITPANSVTEPAAGDDTRAIPPAAARPPRIPWRRRPSTPARISAPGRRSRRVGPAPDASLVLHYRG